MLWQNSLRPLQIQRAKVSLALVNRFQLLLAVAVVVAAAATTLDLPSCSNLNSGPLCPAPNFTSKTLDVAQ